MDIKGILTMDSELIQCAGECGLRPFCIMFGAIEGLNLKPNILSYEGPFGVGYGVITFTKEGYNV